MTDTNRNLCLSCGGTGVFMQQHDGAPGYDAVCCGDCRGTGAVIEADAACGRMSCAKYSPNVSGQQVCPECVAMLAAFNKRYPPNGSTLDHMLRSEDAYTRECGRMKFDL